MSSVWEERIMKRWKKIVLVLVGLLLLSQVPFIYRRYQIGRLHAEVERLNSERVADQGGNGYADYKGVIHVHSLLGGHSTGNFEDIIKAANLNQLSFVIMTEHPSRYVNTALMTLKGLHEGVLFVNGNEISTSEQDRLLLMPGSADPNALGSLSTREVVSREKARGGLAFIAYPQEFRSWEVSDYDGIEIYNLYTNARRINYFSLFFDGLWSYWSYPDLLFHTFYERPGESLQKWDHLNATGNRRLVAIAGNDAHANIGLSLQDAGGRKFLQIQLDPYERSFRVVRTHVLLEKDEPLSEQSLLRALASGHCFISFDLFCDASGFRYSAENKTEKKIMGDEIGLGDGVRLTVKTPVKSRIVLFRDGTPVGAEDETSSKEFLVNQKGVYRVEAYLNQLREYVGDKPWIISNPIYVR